MSAPRVKSVLLVALPLAFGCTSEAGSSEAAKAGPKGQGGPPPALVQVAKAEEGSLTDGWTFLGRVEAALDARIAAAVAGHVGAVTVREGDRVKKNQVLVRLDSADSRAAVSGLEAKVKGLEAQLEIAKKQLERVAELGYPTVSDAEKERFELNVTNLQTELAIQRAELRRSRVALGHHTVNAPFAGSVRARHVDPGDWVAVGAPVLELVSLDDLEVQVDVSAELGSRLSVGDTATLKGPEPAEATIAGLVPALDSETRTMRVRLTPEERPPWLIAGMAIDVEFAVTFASGGVIVPRDALVRGPTGVRVVLAEDGKGTSVPVVVVAAAADRALVRGEGLEAGDQVVIRGNERLRPGQPLRVQEGEGPEAPLEKGAR